MKAMTAVSTKECPICHHNMIYTTSGFRCTNCLYGEPETREIVYGSDSVTQSYHTCPKCGHKFAE